MSTDEWAFDGLKTRFFGAWFILADLVASL